MINLSLYFFSQLSIQTIVRREYTLQALVVFRNTFDDDNLIITGLRG